MRGEGRRKYIFGAEGLLGDFEGGAKWDFLKRIRGAERILHELLFVAVGQCTLIRWFYSLLNKPGFIIITRIN